MIDGPSASLSLGGEPALRGDSSDFGGEYLPCLGSDDEGDGERLAAAVQESLHLVEHDVGRGERAVAKGGEVGLSGSLGEPVHAVPDRIHGHAEQSSRAAYGGSRADQSEQLSVDVPALESPGVRGGVREGFPAVLALIALENPSVRRSMLSAFSERTAVGVKYFVVRVGATLGAVEHRMFPFSRSPRHAFDGLSKARSRNHAERPFQGFYPRN